MAGETSFQNNYKINYPFSKEKKKKKKKVENKSFSSRIKSLN